MEFPVAEDAAVLATLVPAGQTPRFEDGRLLVGDKIADYSASEPPR